MALYLQAVTLLESMVTDPWKEGYCILTPSLVSALNKESCGILQTGWKLKALRKSLICLFFIDSK